MFAMKLRIRKFCACLSSANPVMIESVLEVVEVENVS